MKKETFIGIMKCIKRETDNAYLIQDKINEVFNENGRKLFDTNNFVEKLFSFELTEDILNLLAVEFNDNRHLIEDYVFENNWGADAEDYEPKTLDELYVELTRN